MSTKEVLEFAEPIAIIAASIMLRYTALLPGREKFVEGIPGTVYII